MLLLVKMRENEKKRKLENNMNEKKKKKIGGEGEERNRESMTEVRGRAGACENHQDSPNAGFPCKQSEPQNPRCAHGSRRFELSSAHLDTAHGQAHTTPYIIGVPGGDITRLTPP